MPVDETVKVAFFKELKSKPGFDVRTLIFFGQNVSDAT
jgi:hypothetical protein